MKRWLSRLEGRDADRRDDLDVLQIVVLDHEHARRGGEDEGKLVALERLDGLDGEVDVEADLEDVLAFRKDIGGLAEDFLGVAVVGALGVEDDTVVPRDGQTDLGVLVLGGGDDLDSVGSGKELARVDGNGIGELGRNQPLGIREVATEKSRGDEDASGREEGALVIEIDCALGLGLDVRDHRKGLDRACEGDVLAFTLLFDGIAGHTIGIRRQEIELAVADGDVDAIVDFLRSLGGDGIGRRVIELLEVLERNGKAVALFRDVEVDVRIFLSVFGDKVEVRRVIGDVEVVGVDHVQRDDISAELADDIQKVFGRNLDHAFLFVEDDLFALFVLGALLDLRRERAIAGDDGDLVGGNDDEEVEELILGGLGRNGLIGIVEHLQQDLSLDGKLHFLWLLYKSLFKLEYYSLSKSVLKAKSSRFLGLKRTRLFVVFF